MLQNTLVLLKPDTYEKKIMGNVIADFEKEFKIISLKMVKLKKDQAEEFYAVHKGKDFLAGLQDYVCRGPIVAMLLEGDDVIAKVRAFIGNTNPAKAEKDSIRGKYGESFDSNVVHASDSQDSANTEIPFFFPKYEIINIIS
jgi:nucleoside-diphosphate kinase